MDHSGIEAQWNAVKDDIWHPDEILQGVQDDNSIQQTFKLNGGRLYRELNSSVNIFSLSIPTASPVSIWPLTAFCTNPSCKYVIGNRKLKLQGAIEQEGILYTKE